MHTESIRVAVTLYLRVVALSIAATLVPARLNSSHLNRPFLALASNGDSAPYKRQSTTIPPTCAPICESVDNEASLGCPATVCCTQSFQMTAYTCYLCIGTNDYASNYSQGQAYLDTLYTDCHQLGYILPNLTLPGESPYSTLLTPAIGAPSATAEAPSGGSTATISTPGFVSAAIDVGSAWALAAVSAAAAVGLIVL